VLLLIPLVALLAIPLYNSINPTLGGVPFFYWYQLLWMPLGALLYYIASVIWNDKEKKEESEKRKAARKSSSRKRSRR
jgi:peptidoglycan/LPS O-acetylase OafA/YrhL